MKALAKWCAFIITVAVLAHLGFTLDRFYIQSTANLGVALPQGPAVFETSLQSRISSTDTSMTLVSTSTRGGGYLATGYNCFTVDEGRTDAEFICGTLTSARTITGLERGIDPNTGTSTNSALKFAHRVGADVKISDFPLIQRLRNILNGVEYAPALPIATTTVLITSGSATSTFATKYYVDNVAVAGAPDANETTKGVGELATAAEAAAGTSLGGTAARIVLPASLSTSTPGLSTATGNIPTAVGRYLLQSWLDLTASWTFSLFNATNATTTGNQYFSNAALASTLLKTDSTGKLVPAVAGTDYAKEQYAYATTTSFTITANSSATSTLFSVPASTINASSSIDVWTSITCASGSTCTFKFRTAASSNQVASCDFSPPSAATATGDLHIIITSSNGTASSWRYICTGTMVNGSSPFVATLSSSGTSAIDLTGALTFFAGAIVLNGGNAVINSLTVLVRP